MIKFFNSIRIKNDIKELARLINYTNSGHAIITLRKNQIISINVVLEIDVSDDIFSCEYRNFIFFFNRISNRLLKLLSVHSVTAEYRRF